MVEMSGINCIIACFESQYSNRGESNGVQLNYVSFEYFGCFLKKMGKKLGQ
mgnify:CR=1 FL=1